MTASFKRLLVTSCKFAVRFFRDELSLDKNGDAVEPIKAPGRPDKPVLVPPKNLPKRGMGTTEGRASFLHAITHIEFNAMNLAWDAVYRFRDMPRDFYADFVKVASDEARHFTLLNDRLLELGYQYGDFPAHNGLWEMARKTRGDLLTRIDRKSTRLNSSHSTLSRMPSSA